ncbi:phenylglyoxylate dehydrogenase [Chloroflexota bacterium]
MVTKITPRVEQVRVFDGNRACAYGVLLCKPDLVSCVPITPMTPMVEAIWQYVADGRLNSELVAADGEINALSYCIGASSAGARTFIGTASQGLGYMYEAYLKTAGNRLPVVMALATRENAAPDGVVSSHQDFVTVRDAGWIQIVCEGVQEILDTMIMAYRLAEDPEILLPVNVCFDGYYLSYLTERVELPYEEDVDAFLSPLTEYDRPKLCLEDPLTVPTNTREELFAEWRHKHVVAQQKTKEKLEDIEKEYQEAFGRSYGGQIEEYRTDDAEIVMVSMGSQTGAIKDVVDSRREKGEKIGAIKIRLFRPFPRERLLTALKGKKAIGVVDRNVIFGWQSGVNFLEIKAAIQDLPEKIPVTGFIVGIGGTDCSLEMVERAVDTTQLAAEGKPHQEITWLNIE